MHTAEGSLRKMQVEVASANSDGGSAVHYTLVVGDDRVGLNALLGKELRFTYAGKIHCLHCNRVSKKSFNQGYCYPCFKSLAQCDQCIMSPEKCHFHLGTCREPEWAEQYCMQDHYVYLANSSGLKVGITRGNQIPVRWVDQGAVQAIPIYRVSSRRISGLVEVAFKAHVADKTNWRAMLKGEPELLDLADIATSLKSELKPEIEELKSEYGIQSISDCDGAEAIRLHYPIESYPSKVTSLNFDKTPEVGGKLQGIKGQYLILDTGVINLRKFGGYQVEFSSD